MCFYLSFPIFVYHIFHFGVLMISFHTYKHNTRKDSGRVWDFRHSLFWDVWIDVFLVHEYALFFMYTNFQSYFIFL